MTSASPEPSPKDDLDLAVGVTPGAAKEVITARKAGGITDLDLSISPRLQDVHLALENVAKAMNVALKTDFVETELDRIYKVARVRNGAVHVIHKRFIGLGDGLFATIGKSLRSIRLTFEGPDPASPEGEKRVLEQGTSAVAGVFNLLGRKLDLLQEFEDMVPHYVEQTLDRLEAKRIIKDWHRTDWKIETTSIGLDVIMTPVLAPAATTS